MENWWNKESNETRISFKVKIREISLYQNLWKFGLNFDKNEEQNNFKHKINLSKLIKIQITVRWMINSHC